jgi:hypothetical protein
VEPAPHGIESKILAAIEDNKRNLEYSLVTIGADLNAFLSDPNQMDAVQIIKHILAKHGKDKLAEYMARLANVEIGVERFNPYVRDHVVHSIYVFLIGLLFKSNCAHFSLVKPLSWKLTALLHDVGYPVELFSRSIGEYLNNVYSMKNEIVRSPTSLPTVEYSVTLQDFERLYSGQDSFELINKRLTEWGIITDLNGIYRSRMQNGVVDHGILSALITLNIIDALYVQNNPEAIRDSFVVDGIDWAMDYFYGDVLNAVASIAIHNLTSEELKSKIFLEKAPLPYLLIVSDALQIWNRHSPKLPVYNPNVIEMEFEEDKVKCRLQVNDEDYLRAREDISRIESSKLEIDLQHVKPVAGPLRG